MSQLMRMKMMTCWATLVLFLMVTAWADHIMPNLLTTVNEARQALLHCTRLDKVSLPRTHWKTGRNSLLLR